MLLSYAAASLLHYAHNAEYLTDYPNMPAWISRPQVYVAWFGVTAIGVLGHLLCRREYRIVGLSVIAVYAAFGFDRLGHYSLAPLSAHTVTMNLTIWLEVATAALLLIVVAGLLTTQICVKASMRPTVFRKRGYRFFVFSLEESRMHVHARSPDGEARRSSG